VILQPVGAQALHILGTQVQAAAAQMWAASAPPSLRGAKALLSVAA
jgi:tellurite resistance protein TehA-like permease